MAQKTLVIVMRDGTELGLPKRYEHTEVLQAKVALERLLITENVLLPGKGSAHQPQVVFRQDIKAIKVRDA